MLTKAAAQETVRLVYDALEDPSVALDREEVGPVHAALAPHLRNWQVNGEGKERRMLHVSSAGSINYDLVVPTSDLDLKAVYLPDFSDYYFGKFPKFSFVTDRFDCELHPVHHFVEHSLKGNINFFEFLFAECALATPPWIHIQHVYLEPLVKMNVKTTALATFFTAEQQLKGTKYIEGTDGWNSKKGAMAIRCLVFLIHMLDTGEFELKPKGEIRQAILRLKTGEMPWHEFVGLYEELHATAKGMMFSHFKNGGDFTWTDMVEDMDGNMSAKWMELRQGLDVELMRMVREPIELGYRDQLMQAGWKQS